MNPTLRCVKHGDRVPREQPACPHRDEPCKFRSDCAIFAFGEYTASGKERATNVTTEEQST